MVRVNIRMRISLNLVDNLRSPLMFSTHRKKVPTINEITSKQSARFFKETVKPLDARTTHPFGSATHIARQKVDGGATGNRDRSFVNAAIPLDEDLLLWTRETCEQYVRLRGEYHVINLVELSGFLLESEFRRIDAHNLEIRMHSQQIVSRGLGHTFFTTQYKHRKPLALSHGAHGWHKVATGNLLRERNPQLLRDHQRRLTIHKGEIAALDSISERRVLICLYHHIDVQEQHVRWLGRASKFLHACESFFTCKSIHGKSEEVVSLVVHNVSQGSQPFPNYASQSLRARPTRRIRRAPI